MSVSTVDGFKQGLVGSWSPGIGDPSLGGWLTVLLYVAAAWMTWRVLKTMPKAARNGSHERWFWRLLFLGLILLAVNKQLDLQSALTEVGRMAAERGGWYEDRHQVQAAFIAGVAIMGLTAMAAVLYLVWDSPSETLMTLAGAAGLLIFVIVRAASFHHVDAWLGQDIAGIRMNWLMEMGSLMVILWGSWRRGGRL
jgi:hypothetical protein